MNIEPKSSSKLISLLLSTLLGLIELVPFGPSFGCLHFVIICFVNNLEFESCTLNGRYDAVSLQACGCLGLIWSDNVGRHWSFRCRLPFLAFLGVGICGSCFSEHVQKTGTEKPCDIRLRTSGSLTLACWLTHRDHLNLGSITDARFGDS